MHLCDINNTKLFVSDGYEFDILQEFDIFQETEFSDVICNFPRKLSRRYLS